MLAIDRWRNWQPSSKKFGDSPSCEPPKPSKLVFGGFEGSRLEQKQNFSEQCIRHKDSEMETAMPEEMSQAATKLPGGSMGDQVADASRFERLTPSASMPSHDLAKWREPFSRWLGSACVCSLRSFGGVSRLHIAFCEWEVQPGGVPSTRNTFERLLAERFLIGEVAGVVLVSGLIFREDFEVNR